MSWRTWKLRPPKKLKAACIRVILVSGCRGYGRLLITGAAVVIAMLTSEVMSDVYQPVRMVWKAVSTFVESRADVSRKDKPFFSAGRTNSTVRRAQTLARTRRLRTQNARKQPKSLLLHLSSASR